MAEDLAELPLVLPRTAAELTRSVELIGRKVNEIIRTSRSYLDDVTELDDIPGSLNGSKIYGEVGSDIPLDNITALGATFGSIESFGQMIPSAIGINFSNLLSSNPPLFNIPATAPLVANLDADKLDGQHGAHYHDAGNLTGTLADARLSSNVPLKNTTSTYTAAQIFQRTASNLLAVRFSTAAGAFTEIMVDGSYATGVAGSPRDLRHRRTAAGVLEIDNNAGGAAELDVTGYGLFGGSTVNAQAVLEARSTARGFLPPRMTTTQRDAISATPEGGLSLYNTTVGKMQTWDGAAWQDHW